MIPDQAAKLMHLKTSTWKRDRNSSCFWRRLISQQSCQPWARLRTGSGRTPWTPQISLRRVLQWISTSDTVLSTPLKLQWENRMYMHMARKEGGMRRARQLQKKLETEGSEKIIWSNLLFPRWGHGPSLLWKEHWIQTDNGARSTWKGGLLGHGLGRQPVVSNTGVCLAISRDSHCL